MWKWIQRAKAFVFKALGREGKPTGKPQKLTPKAQERLMQENIKSHAKALVDLTKQQFGGNLSVTDWAQAVKQELKSLYLQSYMLGVGGKSQMGKRDYSSVGGMLREQYRHLAKFQAELQSVPQGQAEQRIQMYANSAREAHERARANVNVDTKQERWVLSPDIHTEHCEDCIAFASRGWQKRHYFPIPGSGLRTRCLTNCACHLEYR